MTDREKAIVMAHTGICMLADEKFSIFHEYVEKILDRPVRTHELPALESQIREKSKPDFLKLCEVEEIQKGTLRDDAISREWLKIAIHNFYYGLKHTPTEEDIQAYIDAAPFVTPQPETGHKELEQEHCEDAISRVSTINAVSEALKHTFVENEEVAKGIINKLPSVNPQQKTDWIPVSEELPKKSGDYLTTTMYREVYCDYWDEEQFERTETVIAWMPLPEPYRAEGSNKE